MLGDGISLAERMASPPELDKTGCLSSGANDFANDGAAHGIDDASELGEPYRLMADIDAAFKQQIFDLPQ